MSDFIFEKLTAEDIDRVSEIENDSFSEPWSRNAFEEALDSDFHRIYCLKITGAGPENKNQTKPKTEEPAGEIEQPLSEKTSCNGDEISLGSRKDGLAEECLLVGYIGFTSVLDEAEITNVAIDKSFRGLGYGSVLMEKLLEIISKEEISRVFLEVRVGNEAAKGLYKKHGFEKIGVRKNFYRFPTEDAIVMMKMLS